MSKSIQTILSSMESYLFNPAAIQAAQVDLINEIHNGEAEIVDASNPFVELLEASAINTVNFIRRDERTLRRMYPSLAQTEEELYPHMSDKDYVDRFAIPAKAKFYFFVNLTELTNKLVLDEATGIRKLVIPRNSYITVADTVFSLEYPVEIRVLGHGGIQVVYDSDKISPTKTLQSNLIDWTIARIDNGTELLGFELEFKQFKIIEYSVSVNASIAINEKIQLTDSFYYCRVFKDFGNGQFQELHTTHSDSVYDVTKPTAILKVIGDTVTIKVPQIYIDTGLVDKSLRIFVYETKGLIDIPLKSYSSDAIEKTFWSIFPNEIDKFVAPLSTFNQWIIQAASATVGGARAMTFAELSERVKNNAVGSPTIPITPSQITSSLSRTGYEIVKNIDNLTDRTYLAVRDLPSPQTGDLITAAASGISTLSSKINDIVGRDTVVDNGDLVTILPGTLYHLDNGILSIVSKAETDALSALPVEQKAIVVSRRNYYYTPFYYVLDTTNDQFSVKAYHLDSPGLSNRSFITENDSSGFQVSISSVSVERSAYGYRILIKTKSSDNWKALDDQDVAIQLSVQPNGGTDRAYVNGLLVGRTTDNERIYEIQLRINSAIDSDGRLAVTNFTMYTDSPRIIWIDLGIRCTVLFTCTAPPQSIFASSQIDTLIGHHLLEEGAYGLTQEEFTLTCGLQLNHLWTRSRSTISEEDYVRWDSDVPAVYEEDVYQIDPLTGAKFSIDNGQIVRNILHPAGDTILNSNGDVVYKHYKDEVKTDAYGNPLIKNPRALLRHIDMALIEAAYIFATDQSTISYRQQIVDKLIEWLTIELPDMGGNLLENTSLYFYPRSSIGYVNVLHGASLETSLEAAQSFQVTYHVRGDIYSNAQLRATIEKNTIKIIAESLKNTKVAISDISESLKEAGGGDILSVSIRGLGGNRNLDMLTVLDSAKRLSIKKKLVNRSDGVLLLQEDVDVVFVRHTLN